MRFPRQDRKNERRLCVVYLHDVMLNAISSGTQLSLSLNPRHAATIDVSVIKLQARVCIPGRRMLKIFPENTSDGHNREILVKQQWPMESRHCGGAL